MMYVIYFQGPDYWREKYYSDLEEAKTEYEKAKEEYSSTVHGASCEKQLYLAKILNGTEIGTGTWGDIYCENGVIIEETDFEDLMEYIDPKQA
jgi:hypothetical protein